MVCYLINNFDLDLHPNVIDRHFIDARLNCGQKCVISPNHCHYCYRIGQLYTRLRQIENNKNEFLIQKTSHIKGGEYSTTGGHVNSGETPLEAIKREVSEEIGIDIETKDIVSLGFYKIGMPLRYLFYIKKDIDINDVKIQEEEVESVKYMDELEIIELINQGKFLESHALLFKELMNKKTSLIQKTCFFYIFIFIIY